MNPQGRNDIFGIFMGNVKDGYLIDAVLGFTLALEASVAASVMLLCRIRLWRRSSSDVLCKSTPVD